MIMYLLLRYYTAVWDEFRFRTCGQRIWENIISFTYFGRTAPRMYRNLKKKLD